MTNLPPLSSLKGTLRDIMIILYSQKSPQSGKITVLIVYVDDIVLSGDEADEILRLRRKMGDEFEIKNLEKLKHFLRMEIVEGISVSQRKYTLDL